MHMTIGSGEDTDVKPGGMACVLGALKMSSSLSAKFDRTTAMDGVQTETVNDIEASWTYHPDNGLDLILVDKSYNRRFN